MEPKEFMEKMSSKHTDTWSLRIMLNPSEISAYSFCCSFWMSVWLSRWKKKKWKTLNLKVLQTHMFASSSWYCLCWRCWPSSLEREKKGSNLAFLLHYDQITRQKSIRYCHHCILLESMMFLFRYQRT